MENEEVLLQDSDDDMVWPTDNNHGYENDADTDNKNIILTDGDLKKPLPHSPREGEYVIFLNMLLSN
ncbi:unnamed protein product [Colias eurytheme]|nr:unnamed protein product [Colias eurytheme]